MKKGPKILLIVLGVAVALVAVAVGVALLSLDSIVKAGVEKGGSYALKVPVKLDSASVSLTKGTVQLKGFSVDNPAGFDQKTKAISFGEVFVSAVPSSMTTDVIEVREMSVRQPALYVEGDLKEGSNINRLLKNLDETIGSSGGKTPGEPAPAQEEKGAEKKLKIGLILIENAKVSLGATLLGGEAASVTVPKIEVRDIGTGPEGPASPADVARKVLDAILAEAAKTQGKVGDAVRQLNEQAGVLMEQVGQGLKGAGKDLEKAGKGAVEELKGLKDIFKKSDKDSSGK